MSQKIVRKTRRCKRRNYRWIRRKTSTMNGYSELALTYQNE